MTRARRGHTAPPRANGAQKFAGDGTSLSTACLHGQNNQLRGGGHGEVLDDAVSDTEEQQNGEDILSSRDRSALLA